MEKTIKPWGYYVNLYGDDNSGYKVKMLHVNPKSRLSEQSHEQRDEHWIVTKGTAIIEHNGHKYTLNENSHYFIPKKTIHRLQNNSETDDLEVVETQLGTYLGEDDITRYEDDYNR
jgi:mannose-6-phosphate isomerase-like protein (cupin superfamily)